MYKRMYTSYAFMAYGDAGLVAGASKVRSQTTVVASQTNGYIAFSRNVCASIYAISIYTQHNNIYAAFLAASSALCGLDSRTPFLRVYTVGSVYRV